MGRARVGVVVTGVRRVRASVVMALAVVSEVEAVRVVPDGATDVGAARVADAGAMKAPWVRASASSSS
ncbi:hypothetical protein [Myxococcus stipitatus]|uniref:hypothetical protein n=1 Tax=Myxococcus stipitatus TaxID=83455 RepID=UPI003AF2821B